MLRRVGGDDCQPVRKPEPVHEPPGIAGGVLHDLDRSYLRAGQTERDIRGEQSHTRIEFGDGVRVSHRLAGGGVQLLPDLVVDLQKRERRDDCAESSELRRALLAVHELHRAAEDDIVLLRLRRQPDRVARKMPVQLFDEIGKAGDALPVHRKRDRERAELPRHEMPEQPLARLLVVDGDIVFVSPLGDIGDELLRPLAVQRTKAHGHHAVGALFVEPEHDFALPAHAPERQRELVAVAPHTA